MKVRKRTEDTLVLVDTQADKKLFIGLAATGLLIVAYFMAVSGGTLFAFFLMAMVFAMGVYFWLTKMEAAFTFDKPSDSVTLLMTDRKGTHSWDWKLSDIAGAEVSEIYDPEDAGAAHRSSIKRPVFVLKDGTKVPMRPYHAAGGQSWQTIEAIRTFMGDPNRDDFPVGYLFDDDN